MLGFGGAARAAGLSDTYGQLEAAIGRPVFGPQAGASMMGLGQMRAGDLYSDQALTGAQVERDLANRRVEGLQAEQGLLPLQLQTGNVRAQAAARQKAREELRRKGLEGYMDLIGGQS
jgi:Asp/Glu/hydantoin racemase